MNRLALDSVIIIISEALVSSTTALWLMSREVRFMDFQFFFKGMDSSEALKELAARKFSERIEKLTYNPHKIRITFFVDGIAQGIQCNLTTRNGDRLHVSHKSPNMYSTIDLVAGKLEAQLKRRKTKRKSHKDRHELGKEKRRMALVGNKEFTIDNEVIDASDIVKFEEANKERIAAGH